MRGTLDVQTTSFDLLEVILNLAGLAVAWWPILSLGAGFGLIVAHIRTSDKKWLHIGVILLGTGVGGLVRFIH